MTKIIKSLARRGGLPPGTISDGLETGNQSLHISCIEYNQERFSEKEIDRVEELGELLQSPMVSWINIEGANAEVLESLKQSAGIHPLVLEDVLHTGQRAKIEDYGDYLFLVVKMLYEDEEGEVLAEQVSMILGDGYLISFQEVKGDVFDAVRNRIRSAKGQVRKMKADYLAYALLDAVVDNYFVVMERIDEDVEHVDDALTVNAEFDLIRNIHSLKRDLIFLRKQVWPLREMVNNIHRKNDSGLFSDTTKVYLGDVYDHVVQAIDAVDSMREMVSSLHDLYLSMTSNRMNEIMKVLTIFAAIFIPLTFVAGIYGMNFEYMPELKWHGGYFSVLGLMALMAIVMLLFFKKKKWF